MLIDREQDTSEYWRETEILTLVRHDEEGIDYEKCEQSVSDVSALRLPARRTVRPICRTAYEREPSSRASIVHTVIRNTANGAPCSCQLIIHNADVVTSAYFIEILLGVKMLNAHLDFRAGCNPYWGHPEQEVKALRCDPVLRRCKDHRRSFRYEPPTVEECPVSCRGYDCQSLVHEDQCPQGAFLPDKDYCNCCGRCSTFFPPIILYQIEEEFLEPGCDDGLVCRQGICQDTHTLMSRSMQRLKREQLPFGALEPCKQEMKYFKKKYGVNGHLHHEAPQCTPLWLYAPVQCRRFVCYCALEDGSKIDGIKVPRVEVSNMNCDCAREKCRTSSDVQCDGYGNYKEAVFMPHVEQWPEQEEVYESDIGEMKASTVIDNIKYEEPSLNTV
ncbi:hypothetical protein RR46_07955 [Papilio xuthus]|uniref:Thyroglobulin type-1 domain-containing protein n=1 Tax=Papilio xuthus TaxID=66420 RepID=A0A194QL76_PAPXU|nr:hypothetical protein RR46_07955 [Papilio xuthus]